MKIGTLSAPALAFALVLLSAACSDDNQPAGPPTTTATTSGSTTAAQETPDPCQLLTPADLLAATGVTFEMVTLDSTDPGPEGYRACQYEEVGDTDGLPDAAWVALYPTNRAEFDAALDSLLALGPGLVEIDGVGEAAYGDEGSIRAFQAPYYVEVQVQGLVQLDGTKTITDLALTVLSRLT